MRRLKTFWLVILALGIAVHLPAAPQKARAPLTEEELERLLTLGASEKAISDLVHKYGVSFQLEERTIERLKKLGAQETLLETVRHVAPAPKRPPKEVVTPPPPPPDPVMLEASRLLKLGEAKAQSRDFEGALEEFVEAEKIRPQWEEVFFQRSLVLAALERYSEAAAEGKKYAAAVKRGTDMSPFLPKIEEWETRAEKNDKANRLVEQGKRELTSFNLEAAIKSLQEAVKLNSSVSNLLTLAGAYLVKGDYESLSKTAELALALDPHSAQALLYKGAAELGQADPHRAMASVQQGLLLNPNLAFGYSVLGVLLRQKRERKNGELEKVSPALIEATSGWAHNQLGWALWNGGHYAEALNELRRAIQIESANAAWYSDVSYALHFRSDEAGALVAARQALRLDSNSPSAHDAMGLALETRGSLDQADHEYQEAVRLSPPDLPEFAYHLNEIKLKRANGHEEPHPLP